MTENDQPPTAFLSFVETYPKLGEAWERAREGETDGPLDEKTRRLIKLAVSMGAMRQGAVHSGVRKALRTGVTEEEILQVVALAATTLGFPSAVATFSWIQDVIGD
ncbi:MAG: carboxymuconolactone decarboxylase family protein [bacterium]|nr:carboxymuconolactone decarboxylase family protein [bacterium]